MHAAPLSHLRPLLTQYRLPFSPFFISLPLRPSSGVFDDGVHTYLIEPLQQTHPIVSYSLHHVRTSDFATVLAFHSEEHVNVAADRAGRQAGGINQVQLAQGEKLCPEESKLTADVPSASLKSSTLLGSAGGCSAVLLWWDVVFATSRGLHPGGWQLQPVCRQCQ